MATHPDFRKQVGLVKGRVVTRSGTGLAFAVVEAFDQNTNSPVRIYGSQEGAPVEGAHPPWNRIVCDAQGAYSFYAPLGISIVCRSWGPDRTLAYETFDLQPGVYTDRYDVVGDATQVDGGGSGTPDGNYYRTLTNTDGTQLLRGMAVYSPSPGACGAALGDINRRKPIGFYTGLTPLDSGNSGPVLVNGGLDMSTADWELVTGMVGGLLRGQRYYLDFDSPGQIRAQVDVSSRVTPSWLVPIGYAVSATEMRLEIGPSIRVA